MIYLDFLITRFFILGQKKNCPKIRSNYYANVRLKAQGTVRVVKIKDYFHLYFGFSAQCFIFRYFCLIFQIPNLHIFGTFYGNFCLNQVIIGNLWPKDIKISVFLVRNRNVKKPARNVI